MTLLLRSASAKLRLASRSGGVWLLQRGRGNRPIRFENGAFTNTHAQSHRFIAITERGDFLKIEFVQRHWC